MTPATTPDAVLQALRRLYHATGEPVTTRELADDLRLSSNATAHRYLTRLVAEGLARHVSRAGFVPAGESVVELRAEVERLRARVAELEALGRRERLAQ